MRMNCEIDISGILHSIKVPTLVLHLTGDTLINVEGGRELAAGIPNARLVERPGTDHIPFLEAGDWIVAEIEEFITGSRSTPIVDRVLTTVVFTDIVDLTARADAKVDVRRGATFSKPTTKRCARNSPALGERKSKLSGDGFGHVRRSSARAIHCARAIRDFAVPA